MADYSGSKFITFMQQDGREKMTAKRLCVTNVTNVTGLLFAYFFRDLHLTLIFSGLLQIELFKGR